MSERWSPPSPDGLRIEDLEGKETLQPKPVRVIDDNPAMQGALGRIMGTYGMTDATLVFAHLIPKDKYKGTIDELRGRPSPRAFLIGKDGMIFRTSDKGFLWENIPYK